MEYVILGLLMINNETLYSLKKSFEMGISLFFTPSFGSINSAVKRLLDKGYIKQENTINNGRAKNILSITNQGQKEFFLWLETPLDTKNLEVSFLSRLYFLGIIEDENKKKDIVSGMYNSVKDSRDVLLQTETELDKYNIPNEFKEIFKYQKKVLTYGVDTHNYALGWIEKLINELRDI